MSLLFTSFPLTPFSSLIGPFYSSNKCCNTLNSTQCNAAYIISCFYSLLLNKMLSSLIIYKMAVTFNCWNIKDLEAWKHIQRILLTTSWGSRSCNWQDKERGSLFLQYLERYSGRLLSWVMEWHSVYSIVEVVGPWLSPFWGLKSEVVKPAFFSIWLSRDL